MSEQEQSVNMEYEDKTYTYQDMKFLWYAAVKHGKYLATCPDPTIEPPSDCLDLGGYMYQTYMETNRKHHGS